MAGPRDFIHRHLDPVDRLGEVLFGLIMALGFTGAVRLGYEEADSRELFVGILGCNVAWGIVDGVMYVLTSLFERGRRARVIRDVLAAPTEEAALARIGAQLDDRLGPFTTTDERAQLYGGILRSVRSQPRQVVHVTSGDVLGGVAVGLIVLLATLPMLVPYWIVRDPTVAVRLSHGIGVALVFLVGVRWGKAAGASPWRIGLGLAVLGLVLVGVTVVLGG